MHNMKKITLFALPVLLLSACTSIGYVERGAAAPDESEGFFLVGVRPENVLVAFDPRLVRNGMLVQVPSRTTSFLGRPEDGFILGRTRPGDTITFAGVTLTRPDGTKKNAISCGKSYSMAFNTPGGKVTYVGDVIISEVGDKLQIRTEFNPAAAQKLIEEKYPAMKGVFAMKRHVLMPTTRSCTQVVYTYR